MIAHLLPQIQKLINADIINSFKKNGSKTVAKSLYTMLPGAIRLLVKEETFINFCLSHQDKIFGKTPAATSVKKSAKKITGSKSPQKKVVKKNKK